MKKLRGLYIDKEFRWELSKNYHANTDFATTGRIVGRLTLHGDGYLILAGISGRLKTELEHELNRTSHRDVAEALAGTVE